MAANTLLNADFLKSLEKANKKLSDIFEQTTCGSVEVGAGGAKKSSSKLCHELFSNILNGSLKYSQICTVLQQEMEANPGLRHEAVSVLCIIDMETKVNQNDKMRKNLISLIKEMENLLPASLLKEQLDPETLQEIGVANATQFNQKCIKVKTKIYYKQLKFNLLREEMEGYSKLITEISQEPSSALPSSAILQNIMSLIGCFNLDPNRVLEVILQVFENRLELSEELFIPLLRNYTPGYDTLCQMVGFRLHSFSTGDESLTQSKRVFDVISQLLKHDLLTLDSVYTHLSPSDKTIRELYRISLTDARQSVKKTKAVHTGEKDKNAVAADEIKDKHHNTQDILLTNQKLGLIEALLNNGCWSHAKQIMDRLPQYHAVSFPAIATVLCRLISTIIDPIYQQYSGLPKRLARTKEVDLESCPLSPARTWDDVIQNVFPMLRTLGCHISCDTKLTIKVIRIVKTFITQRKSGKFSGYDEDILYRHCLSIIDEVILPSLCLTGSNCCMAEQVWSLLQLLPYEHRYQLYGEWKSTTYYTQPELISSRLETLKKAKYIFSRLTKENVKQQGRQIGKVSHANPVIFFEYMLTQVQVYDNLIGPIVDSLKFVSSLSYDVLAYCLIDALAAPDKERMKLDDTNLSQWLKSLANFTGLVLKKYQVEFSGVLQYICNQLKAEKSYDLLILREMLTKMGGIEVTEEITDQQLDAMCGGELLRQEGGNFLQLRNVKKPSQRLKETLLSNNQASPLCILMAQQRDCIIYKITSNTNMNNQEQIKLIGKIYDQCQDTLIQFMTFLISQLTMEELSTKLPSLEMMLSEYHVPFDAAFFLYRPTISHCINIRYETLRKQDRQIRESDSKAVTADKTTRYMEAFTHVIEPVTEKIRLLHNNKVWDDINPLIYTTFWTLQAYDLHVPRLSYEREINLVKQKIDQIEQEAGRDMREGKKRKEIERCNQMIMKFKDEEKRQIDHCQRVLAKLEQDKEKWFKSVDTQKQVERFIQHCIFPRIMLTTVDAFYTAQMLHIMHKIKTPNFGTLIVLDRIFNDITYLITCCTENEAYRYGRFLCSVLGISEKWRSSEDIYKKECSGHPGFITTFRSSAQKTNYAELNFEDFRHVCHKWQFRMTKAVFVCFDSGTYTQTRNALIVLTKVLPYFPVIVGIGQAIERRVDKIHKEEKDKRHDLYALAMGYAGLLKGKKSNWIPEQFYHHVDEEKLRKRQEAKSKAAVKKEVIEVKKEQQDDIRIIEKKPVNEKAAEKKSSKEKTGEKRAANEMLDKTKVKTEKKAAISSKASKDRQEAAAFLKEVKANESMKEPEGPAVKKVKSEPGSSCKTVSNGTHSSPSSKESPGSSKKTVEETKEKSKTSKDVKIKTEKRSSSREKDKNTSRTEESSPANKSTDDRESKKRKVDELTRSKQSASQVKVSPSHEGREKKSEKDRKRVSDASTSSPREVEIKKRRSDVREDRVKNGADGDKRTDKRSNKEEVMREKERKSAEKPRSRRDA